MMAYTRASRPCKASISRLYHAHRHKTPHPTSFATRTCLLGAVAEGTERAAASAGWAQLQGPVCGWSKGAQTVVYTHSQVKLGPRCS